MPAALPDNFERRLRALHRNGNSRNAIAQKLGVSPSTVTNHCKRLGLNFERNETAAAVAAHQVDLRARRVAILARLYDRIEKNLDRLEADGYTYSLVLPGGAESAAYIAQQTDDDPPSGDERNHMSTVTGYLAAATKLEAVDSNSGESDAASLLSRLADTLWGSPA
jgi:hypothetical protein